MAIILILTLTIDAFDPKDGAGGTFRAAGDYSAVFPLLTVSVFVALQVSRQTIFYEKQRSRGDILALPEVLCEPGKDGRPLVMDYEGNLHEIDESNDDYESDEISADSKKLYMSTDDGATQKEIEAQFNAQLLRVGTGKTGVSSPSKTAPPSPLPPRPREKKGKRSPQMRENPKSRQFDEGRVSTSNVPGPSQTLDELLSASLGNEAPILNKTHRRTRSEPFEDCISMTTAWGTGKSFRERKSAGVSTLQNIGKMPISLKRVSSFGQVDQEQPSLLDQARNRAASFASGEKSKKIQSKGITVSSGSPRLQGRKKL